MGQCYRLLMLIISLAHAATTCQYRWKTAIHNITIWLFLDTQGENRLHSGPNKREFLSPSPTQRPPWKLPPRMPLPT